MKQIALVLALVALLAGCTSKTEYGQCIGAFDDKRPELHYKASAKNIVMAIIFSETIIVPVVVAVDETMCPDGTNPKK
jgi:hypothetical protein